MAWIISTLKNIKNIMKQEKSSIGIHFFYVTLILVAIIVLLATAKWTELPKFTDYLSAAGTITSLVLGILAIIYSFVSNDSISQSSGVLRDTADSAKKAAFEVENLLGDFKALDENTRLNNESISKIISQLSSSLNSLEKSTVSLAEQNSRFHEAIEKIPFEIENLGNKVDAFWESSNLNGRNSSIESTISGMPSSAVIDFIEGSSPRGKLLCYWAYKSYINNKSFSFDEVFLAGKDDGSYEWGYFIAMKAMGLIKSAANGDSHTITYVADGFECIEDKILKVEEIRKISKFKEKWQNEVSRANRYFDEVADNDGDSEIEEQNRV